MLVEMGTVSALALSKAETSRAMAGSGNIINSVKILRDIETRKKDSRGSRCGICGHKI